jgi:hypothetical protein
LHRAGRTSGGLWAVGNFYTDDPSKPNSTQCYAAHP